MSNLENKHITIFEFDRVFKEYHKNYFNHWKVSSLVEQENILSQLIDSDLFSDFVLADEVIMLYDLIRDECVRRLALSIREGD